MKILNNILCAIFLLIGVFGTLIGMLAPSDQGINTISVVIGGGLFMALGITIFILNRNN
ncbi:MAG: hypothetical protein AAB446_00605 [Patescibacteria group bacterium]